MKWALVALGLTMAACAPLPDDGGGPVARPAPMPDPVSVPDEAYGFDPDRAARNFSAVVQRVEPVAERTCREQTRNVDCNLQIVVDTRPGQQPNAFQTQDEAGRPVLGFNLALIAEARNQDELAFVMGHEAAHHIAGHIGKTRQTAYTGAALAGVLAQISGANPDAIRTAQNIGANVGARTYSKSFELEADALGTVIAYDAGYDPERGAQFFARIPDPGDRFLGTHPPNAQRVQTVRDVLSRLR